MESTLTTGLPYLRIALGENTSIWGVLGRGKGTMTLSREGLGSVETDIAMDMGAVGFRRDLKKNASECRCFDLAIKSDVLVLDATSDRTAALPELSSDVNRTRLMIEGSRTRKLDSGALLAPSAELGFRHDGGDAETGGGMELGAGVRYAHPLRGVFVHLQGRSLLAHESGELTEWGLAGAIRVDPGAADRGLAFGLRSSWGRAASGASRLWQQQAGMARRHGAAQPRATAEADLGYGLELGDGRVRLMPYLGAGTSEDSGQAYRIGLRLRLRESLDLDLEGMRRERIGHLPPSFAVGLTAALLW